MKPADLTKREWLIWLVIIAPCILIGIKWMQFPDSVPVHYDINGMPNRYGGKVIGLLMLPTMNLGIYFLCVLLPFIDPRKENYVLFERRYKMLRLLIHTLLSYFSIISAVFALKLGTNNALFLSSGLVVFMLLLGNYLSGVRSNFFIGFRTPWTLSDERNWVQTHRFVGRLWVILSAVLLFVFILFPGHAWLLIPYLVILTLTPIAYSYYLFWKQAKKQ